MWSKPSPLFSVFYDSSHANDTGQQDGNREAEQESCSCVHEAEPPDSQKPFEVKHLEGTA